jgi:hypothetical protein
LSLREEKFPKERMVAVNGLLKDSFLHKIIPPVQAGEGPSSLRLSGELFSHAFSHLREKGCLQRFSKYRRVKVDNPWRYSGVSKGSGALTRGETFLAARAR